MQNIEARVEVAKAAAMRAGAAILEFDPSGVDSTVKSTTADFVTEADLASEKIIVKTIHNNFPDDLIITEETTANHHLLTPDKIGSFTGWVIDPLDGTNNFKQGMSYSAVSIGGIENGEPVIGVVYDPFRHEMYIAVKGQGTTRNDRPIKVSDKPVLGPSTRVCTSNSYDADSMKANLARYSKLGQVWVDVLGSAVLIMTDVASGRLDLFHHNGLKPWDNAADFLIAQEAGAKITDLAGKPTNWLTNEVVVGNQQLVNEFIAKTTK